MGLFNDKCMSPMEKDFKDHQMHRNEMRELDDFKKCITDIVENYIKMIDTKISSQDLKISIADNFMRTNIVEATTQVVAQAIENGDIKVAIKYNEETESLDIVITNEDLSETVVAEIRDGTLVVE